MTATAIALSLSLSLSLSPTCVLEAEMGRPAAGWRQQRSERKDGRKLDVASDVGPDECQGRGRGTAHGERGLSLRSQGSEAGIEFASVHGFFALEDPLPSDSALTARSRDPRDHPPDPSGGLLWDQGPRPLGNPGHGQARDRPPTRLLFSPAAPQWCTVHKAAFRPGTPLLARGHGRRRNPWSMIPFLPIERFPPLMLLDMMRTVRILEASSRPACRPRSSPVLNGRNKTPTHGSRPSRAPSVSTDGGHIVLLSHSSGIPLVARAQPS
ncbi:hypothetical protein LX36DRAFT_673213 [Colletotrichum falcatum]|nr:hypothetical protein LX36DRAFT_673213 [Colletotrichum falcatum]